MTDVGGLGGDSASGPNSEDYYLGVNGFDNVSGYNTPYDEIPTNNRNRWHLQGYFDQLPQPSGAMNPSSVNYRIENATSDYLTDFDEWTPNESEMASGGSFSAGPFTIVAPWYPYLAAGSALIDYLLSGSGNGSVTPSSYSHVEWSVPLDFWGGMPASQDPSSGVYVDVQNYASSSDGSQTVDVTSEFSYYEFDGVGGNYWVTNQASDSITYDIG